MKRKMVSALLCATMVAGMVVVPATATAAGRQEADRCYHADQGISRDGTRMAIT